MTQHENSCSLCTTTHINFFSHGILIYKHEAFQSVPSSNSVLGRYNYIQLATGTTAFALTSPAQAGSADDTSL